MVLNSEIETALGVFELVKPKAGVRNRALAAAESDTGKVKFASMMMCLLPNCISKRPAGVDEDVPIGQILDSLEIEDYDLLVAGLSKLLNSHEKPSQKAEEEKKT